MLATLGTLLGLAGAAYFAPHPLRYMHQRWLRRRCADSRSIVLTYDDGPSTSLTLQLLECLAANDVKATFFLLGRRVVRNEAIVDRIRAEGHEIGSHGQQHVNAWRIWPWRAVADIRAGYRTLVPWVDGRAVFRPPYGKLSLPTWWVVCRAGACFGWWTIDSGDTHAELHDPQRIVDAVSRAGGGVVLMHDFDRGADRCQYVLKLTEMLIDLARREGMRICRMSDLCTTQSPAPPVRMNQPL